MDIASVISFFLATALFKEAREVLGAGGQGGRVVGCYTSHAIIVVGNLSIF